jgi:hypothetical protein
LRPISGPKRKEEKIWRKLHGEKLQNMYSSSNVIPVIKKWRKKCDEQATCMGKMRIPCKYVVENFEEKNKET